MPLWASPGKDLKVCVWICAVLSYGCCPRTVPAKRKAHLVPTAPQVSFSSSAHTLPTLGATNSADSAKARQLALWAGSPIDPVDFKLMSYFQLIFLLKYSWLLQYISCRYTACNWSSVFFVWSNQKLLSNSFWVVLASISLSPLFVNKSDSKNKTKEKLIYYAITPLTSVMSK